MLFVSGTGLVLASWAFMIALIFALGVGPAIALSQGAGSGAGAGVGAGAGAGAGVGATGSSVGVGTVVASRTGVSPSISTPVGENPVATSGDIGPSVPGGATIGSGSGSGSGFWSTKADFDPRIDSSICDWVGPA